MLSKISRVILLTLTTILSCAGSSLISQMVNFLLLLIIQPKSLREVEIILGKFQAEKDPFEKKFVNLISVYSAYWRKEQALSWVYLFEILCVSLNTMELWWISSDFGLPWSQIDFKKFSLWYKDPIT